MGWEAAGGVRSYKIRDSADRLIKWVHVSRSFHKVPAPQVQFLAIAALKALCCLSCPSISTQEIIHSCIVLTFPGPDVQLARSLVVNGPCSCWRPALAANVGATQKHSGHILKDVLLFSALAMVFPPYPETSLVFWDPQFQQVKYGTILVKESKRPGDQASSPGLVWVPSSIFIGEFHSTSRPEQNVTGASFEGMEAQAADTSTSGCFGKG